MIVSSFDFEGRGGDRLIRSQENSANFESTNWKARKNYFNFIYNTVLINIFYFLHFIHSVIDLDFFSRSIDQSEKARQISSWPTDKWNNHLIIIFIYVNHQFIWRGILDSPLKILMPDQPSPSPLNVIIDKLTNKLIYLFLLNK